MNFEQWFYSLPFRLRSFFRPNQVDQEMKTELREHFEQQMTENIASGMSPQEARRSATLSLGGITQIEQQCRDARGGNLAVVDVLRRVGERKKATAAQFNLAWLLAQKAWIIPIPGTRKLGHLEENIGAINIELATSDLRELDSAYSNVKVQGARLSEEQIKLIDHAA